MTKKERLEDLGRIAELLKILGDHTIFDIHNGRPKEFPEWFNSQTAETKSETLYQIGYGIRDISEKLAECEVIARGLEDD